MKQTRLELDFGVLYMNSFKNFATRNRIPFTLTHKQTHVNQYIPHSTNLLEIPEENFPKNQNICDEMETCESFWWRNCLSTLEKDEAFRYYCDQERQLCQYTTQIYSNPTTTYLWEALIRFSTILLFR